MASGTSQSSARQRPRSHMTTAKQNYSSTFEMDYSRRQGYILSEIRLTLTKRLVLSDVAQIFDPFGFVSPVVIKAKVWLQKLGYSSSAGMIPYQPRWFTIRNQLKLLRSVSAQLAVIYLTVRSPSTGPSAALICSMAKRVLLKAHNSSVRTHGGAHAGSRLKSSQVTTKATSQLKAGATHLWMDAQVTLIWIKAHASHWTDFVRNRMAQIQELCTDSTWRHIPGSINPAGCASRGVTIDQLKDHPLWWTGPQWLSHGSRFITVSIRIIFITRQFGSSSCSDFSGHIILTIVLLGSSIPILIVDQIVFRVIALCMRFIRKLNHSLDGLQLLSRCRKWNEQGRCEIKATQAACFAPELKSLVKGSPFPAAHPFSRLIALIDNEDR